MRSWFKQLLASVGIVPTSDIHSAYGFLDTLELEGVPVMVAKWPSTRYHVYWPNWLRRPATLAYNHASLAVQIVRGVVAGRIVVVREFNNSLFLLLLPLILPLRKRLILNINDNLAADMRRLSRVSFAILRNLGFRVLLLDGEAVTEDLQRQHPGMRLLAPYFAVSDRRRQQRLERNEFVVGFVGYFRRDKGGIEALAQAIREVRKVEGVIVALGYWNREQIEALPADVKGAARLRDTMDPTDYSEFLYSCDAVVILASEAYRMRHSGILVDTLSRGTLAICPSLPLLGYQVLQPAPVGATYSTLAELPEAISAVRAQRSRLLGNFDEYLSRRSWNAVSGDLEAQWRQLTNGSRVAVRA
jgi:hypothetical protein